MSSVLTPRSVLKVKEGKAEEETKKKLSPRKDGKDTKGELSFTLTEAVLVFILGPRCSKLGSGNLMFSVKSDIRS